MTPEKSKKNVYFGVLVTGYLKNIEIVDSGVPDSGTAIFTYEASKRYKKSVVVEDVERFVRLGSGYIESSRNMIKEPGWNESEFYKLNPPSFLRWEEPILDRDLPILPARPGDTASGLFLVGSVDFLEHKDFGYDVLSVYRDIESGFVFSSRLEGDPSLNRRDPKPKKLSDLKYHEDITEVYNLLNPYNHTDITAR